MVISGSNKQTKDDIQKKVTRRIAHSTKIM